MSDHSNIQWTDSTWPVVTGCTKVSEGCRGCYAIRDAWRLGHNPNPKVSEVYSGTVEKKAGKLDWTGLVKTHPDRLDWPLRWKKPRKIFVCNESDLFHEDVPDEFIDRVFLTMFAAKQHTFQLLTKRAERMHAYFSADATVRRLTALFAVFCSRIPGARLFLHDEPDGLDGLILENVWTGVSIEDRKALHRLGLLRRTPAAVRFLSLEPLLEDLGSLDLTGIDLCIVGGESGPGARPCDLAWIRSIVQQCQTAGVKVFVKQLGAVPTVAESAWRSGECCWLLSSTHRDRVPVGYVPLKLQSKKGGDPAEWPEDLRVRELP
jgi:protein gp37